MPEQFSQAEQDIVLPLLIKGFQDAAADAGVHTNVIGNISINPWCIIGGTASSICINSEMISPNAAKAGDLLVLTKPLGTQLATNAYIWLQDNAPQWQKLQHHFTVDQITYTYQSAIASMIALNRTAAQLMHKYKAHAATDITGFGLIGHTTNLAKFQYDSLLFKISILPVIKNVTQMSRVLGMDKLFQGKAVETSGGLLIAMDATVVELFLQDFHSNTGKNAWIVGSIEAAPERLAVCMKNLDIIDADEYRPSYLY